MYFIGLDKEYLIDMESMERKLSDVFVVDKSPHMIPMSRYYKPHHP